MASETSVDVELFEGDCRALLARMAAAGRFVDAVVTDPPYGVGFMQNNWDRDSLAFDPGFWEQVAGVLKPGGHVACFGATRTWHRAATAIEDAGFEIRDTISWLFTNAMPKGLDVSAAVDAHLGVDRVTVTETVTLPAPEGTLFDLDPVTVDNITTLPGSAEGVEWDGWNTVLKPGWEPVIVARKPLDGPSQRTCFVTGPAASTSTAAVSP